MAPPSALEDIKAQFTTAIDLIRKGAAEVVAQFNALVEQVKRWAWLLGGATMLWIKHNLDAAAAAIKKILATAQEVLAHSTPILSVITTSFEWISRVETPMSGVVATLAGTDADGSVNYGMDAWTGAAATAYSRKVGVQKAAAEDVVAKAEFMSAWLFKVAKGNIEYVAELAKVVTKIAGKVVAALADAETVVGIPWAVSELSNGVADIVEGGLNTLIDMGQKFVAAVGDVRDLAGKAGDQSKLPHGTWPQAVAG
ncbi:hypothetical protein R8Z50_30175 [Longispora sp. K20-0274]|uniref:hypothetical protein n=1 Tax=Longispora sp. K20-0274 TaxID=3088255 RepID=UPI00399A3EC9